jgi:hypothetical protein
MVHISAAIGQFFEAIVRAVLLSAGAAIGVGVLAAVSIVGTFLALRWLLGSKRR